MSEGIDFGKSSGYSVRLQQDKLKQTAEEESCVAGDDKVKQTCALLLTLSLVVFSVQCTIMAVLSSCLECRMFIRRAAS